MTIDLILRAALAIVILTIAVSFSIAVATNMARQIRKP